MMTMIYRSKKLIISKLKREADNLSFLSDVVCQFKILYSLYIFYYILFFITIYKNNKINIINRNTDNQLVRQHKMSIK